MHTTWAINHRDSLLMWSEILLIFSASRRLSFTHFREEAFGVSGVRGTILMHDKRAIANTAYLQSMSAILSRMLLLGLNVQVVNEQFQSLKNEESIIEAFLL
jgi:hypothetical protein